jgi:gliding motility-associated-like protein
LEKIAGYPRPGPLFFRFYSSNFIVNYQISAMKRLGMKLCIWVIAAIQVMPSAEQSQSCPINIDFSKGSLLHWEAYTGNNALGNDSTAIKLVYDSLDYPPGGTIDATRLPEYNLPSVDGIQVITGQGTDAFGGFPMIPTINGYAYHYSILLGSTSVIIHGGNGQQGGQPGGSTGQASGGYVRGVRYLINVPPGPASVPYTMTYAYAMVLENGTHASENQPMARAIVSTPGGVIDCASPEYFLPTIGTTLDSATARANGFSPSPIPSPNPATTNPLSDTHLQDVWTKGWTEVTFDLSAYRGQQVTLTFEADNCVPGGHFAYAYFTLRDDCAGLRIGGDTIACSHNVGKYSIPALNNATVAWSAPAGWTIDSGGNSNIVTVTVGPTAGWIVAKEQNSCTSLTDSLFVDLYKGALPQATIDPRDTTVCYGSVAPLNALITTGTEYTWITSGAYSGARKGDIPSVPFAAGVVANPEQTADYILNIRNDGCPIAVSDTFTVRVVPPIRVNPGSDTLVVLNQPLQFQATSTDLYRDTYRWSPSTDLNNPDISDPIGVYGPEMNTITYLVTATDSFGCYGTASVKVTVAHTAPDIFVPNAFTPGAGSNTLFRPVCIGISTLDYFRVFNRWGQLVFNTNRIGQGWDGRIQGQLQESNAYLWIARGTDYTGRVISKKGTVVLIR